MPENSSFRRPFLSQRIKGSEILLKFAWKQFYANFNIKQIELCIMFFSRVWNLRTAF